MKLPVSQKIEFGSGFKFGFFKRISALLAETREMMHEIHEEEHTILWKW